VVSSPAPVCGTKILHLTAQGVIALGFLYKHIAPTVRIHSTIPAFYKHAAPMEHGVVLNAGKFTTKDGYTTAPSDQNNATLGTV
jgi:hypothetical protein